MASPGPSSRPRFPGAAASEAAPMALRSTKSSAPPPVRAVSAPSSTPASAPRFAVPALTAQNTAGISAGSPRAAAAATPAQEKAAYSVARWVFGGANPKFSAPKAAATPASRAPSHLPGAYPAAASAGSSTDMPAIRETRVAASPAMAGKCRASASQAR